MRFVTIRRLAVFLCCTIGAFQSAAQDPETITPWRRSDRTFVQLCFDGLDASAPKRLRALAVSPGSMGSASLDLVGFTLTNRPIYQGAVDHPVRFRSLLFQLPGSSIWARIDAPSDLSKRIEVWRDIDISQCTADDAAGFKILHSEPVESASCPDLGMKASMKVAPNSEHSITQIHLRSDGPSSFNGLRGCREFVYVPQR